MPRGKIDRLSADDWVAAGFRALSSGGERALKAEALARDLRTTKGSFYWHFADMPTFRRQMLERWLAGGTAEVIREVEELKGTGRQRLLQLARLVSSTRLSKSYGGHAVEPAIRDWARHDRQAARAVRKVDAMRIAYLSALLAASGIAKKDSLAKAELLYASYLGLQALAASRPMEIENRMNAIIALLLNPKKA